VGGGKNSTCGYPLTKREEKKERKEGSRKGGLETDRSADPLTIPANKVFKP